MQCLNRLFTDRGYAIGWAVIGFVAISVAAVVSMIVFVIVMSISADNDDYAQNVITVEGIGEVNSSPDVVNFSFSVEERADTFELAQQNSAKRMNAILDYLKEQEIEEKDVQATGYNVYPRYEWVQEVCQFDRPSCPQGKNVLQGYEASQNVNVKIRDIEKAGEILSGVASLNVTNISGLQFTIDDDASLKEEAQKLAIQDAKERAKRLADELGVDLKDVVSFYENNGGYPEPYMEKSVMMSDSANGFGGSVAPQLPTGENTITSRVSVTYEIK